MAATPTPGPALRVCVPCARACSVTYVVCGVCVCVSLCVCVCVCVCVRTYRHRSQIPVRGDYAGLEPSGGAGPPEAASSKQTKYGRFVTALYGVYPAGHRQDVRTLDDPGEDIYASHLNMSHRHHSVPVCLHIGVTKPNRQHGRLPDAPTKRLRTRAIS